MKRKTSLGVCFIVENEPVPFDRRVWQEARALAGAGYRVSVICPKELGYESSRETLEGVEIYRHRVWRAKGYFGYFIEYGFALVMEFYLAWKIYLRHPFQILHACNPPDTTFLIALPFRLLGVRFVFDHHDLSPELFLFKFPGHDLIRKVVLFFERLSFRFADLTIATNESYRDVAIERGGMRPERVVVVQTCADTHDILRMKVNPALKCGKKYMVLFVGIMERQDGVALLIESIRYLTKDRHLNDTHFVLAGPGTELPFLKTLATRLGLDRWIEFTGLLTRDQVESYMSTADVCVAPDPLNPLNDKCTMIKILEYMAHSKPTVLYDLKEGRRTAGEGALYASPNDPIDFANQIEKLLRSEDLRSAIGEHARRRVEDGLNWDAQKEKLLVAYNWLLAPVTFAPVRKV